jgi:hypothetical protein
VAECGGLLNLPRYCRFNSANNLRMGAGALKWGESASFGTTCSPICSPNVTPTPDMVCFQIAIVRLSKPGAETRLVSRGSGSCYRSTASLFGQSLRR